MTTNQINAMFTDLVDGDEFDSSDAALRVMQLAYDDLTDQRDWWFLMKSATIPLSDLSLPSDCDKAIRVFYVDSAGNVDETPLKRASLHQRHDATFDYYIDEVDNKIVLINSLSNGSLLVDYKYRPPRLTLDDETEPVLGKAAYHPLIAIYMKKQFKNIDENEDFYRETGIDFNLLEQRMIDDDASRKIIYG